jgi:hypothetical protein
MRSKVAAVATLAVLAVTSTAAAAVATRMLPTSTLRHAHAATATASTMADHTAARAHGQAAPPGPAATSTASSPPSTAGQTGSAAVRTASQGLCRAWLAGRGHAAGKQPDAVAFRTLTTAAGGPGKVTAYCRTLAAATASSHGSEQAATRPGPDIPSTASRGWCRGWLAGREASGKRPDAAAFGALSAAAGGAVQVATYCRDLLAATPTPGPGPGGERPAAPGH